MSFNQIFQNWIQSLITTVNSTVLFFKVIEIIQTHYSTDYRFKKKTLTDLQLPCLMYYFLHWSLIFLMFSLFWCLCVSSLPWYEISTYHWITYDLLLLEYLNVVNITDGITTTCNVCSKIYTGLLIGCGKKRKILRHFQGKLCGKKGPLCGKLCDFLKLI